MKMHMLRYVGQTVEIIYCRDDGSITQRRIEVRSVNGSSVKAFCLKKRAPRVFRIDNILAVQLVKMAS